MNFVNNLKVIDGVDIFPIMILQQMIILFIQHVDKFLVFQRIGFF